MKLNNWGNIHNTSFASYPTKAPNKLEGLSLESCIAQCNETLKLFEPIGRLRRK